MRQDNVLSRYNLEVSYCKVPLSRERIAGLNGVTGMVLAIEPLITCDLPAAGSLDSDYYTYVIMPPGSGDKQRLDPAKVRKPFTVWEFPKREVSDSVAGILEWMFRH